MRLLALAALTAIPLAAGAGTPQPPVEPGPTAPLVFASGPMLGVELVPTTAELRVHLGADRDRGALVGRVLDDSAADRAGVRVGDLLLEIGSDPVQDVGTVRSALARHAGEDVDVLVVRDGKRRTLRTTLPDGEGVVGGMSFREPLDGLEGLKALEGLEGLKALEGLEGLKALEGLEGVKALEGLEGVTIIQGVDADVQDRIERIEDRLDDLQDRLDSILDAIDE